MFCLNVFQIVDRFHGENLRPTGTNAISDQILIFIRAHAIELYLCMTLTKKIQLSGILEQHEFLGYSVIQTIHFCQPSVYIPFTMSRSC